MEPKKLPDNMSTSISTSKPIAQNFSYPKKVKQNIKEVMFNDKSAMLNPNRESDYIKNFKEPEKSDYYVKRNQTYYPNNPQTMNKNTQSEYARNFCS